MSAVPIVAACWLTPAGLIVAWVYADRWLDGRHAAEQEHEPEETSAEWLAILAATEDQPPLPQRTRDAEEFARARQESLMAHPSAVRIRQQINENNVRRLAAELDDEEAIARWLA